MSESEATLSGRLAQRIFRSVCIEPRPEAEPDHDGYFRWRLEQAKAFLARFGRPIDFSGRTVLDFGCGFGSMSFVVASKNAKRVVGIDIDDERLDYARRKLAADYASLSPTLHFCRPEELRPQETFDVVISEDSFEHYEDPARIMNVIRGYLGEHGKVLIGFGPLWKSPRGGHLGYMTKVPWAHLLFPERVILRERRRFRPLENARTFAEVRGGLNKMTLEKFIRTIAETGYEVESISTNVLNRRTARVLNVIRRLPGCREYFTVNVYAIVSPRRTASSVSDGDRLPSAVGEG